jgi:hypothetical protein
VCFTNAPAWIGPPDAAIRYRKVGTAAGERKARNSTRRKYIIRADGDAGNSTGVLFEPTAALPTVVCEPPKPAAHTPDT